LQDLAGNSNVASNQVSRDFDTVSPSVIVSTTTTSPTNQSIVPVTIAFSEGVSGFDLGDLSVVNGIASNLSVVSPSTYTVDIAPSVEGSVAVSVGAGAALDDAGNQNSASSALTLIYDITSPTVALSSPAAATTNTSPISVNLVFSEPITGFTASDVSVTNGTVQALSGSGANYSVSIAPTSEGTVEVWLEASVAVDQAGNGNQASAHLSRIYDATGPTTTLSTSFTPSTNQSPFSVSVSFTESISGLTLSDFIVGNGSASNLQGSGTTYSLDISPASEGTVSISLPLGAAVDAAGNNSEASNELSVIYDLGTLSVTVSSSAPSPTNTEPIPFTITFSEVPLGFTSSDITVAGGSVASFSGSGATRSIAVQPSGQGNVEVSIPADVAFDVAGNGNSPSNTVMRTYDSVAPTAPVITAPIEGAIVGDAQPTLSGTAEVGSIVTLREGSEVLCTGTATAGDGTWSCQPASPLSEGRHGLSATATDAANNTSPASTTRNIVIDVLRLAAPTVDPAVSEITSDLTPSVFGVGPAEKRVSIREGATTLCSTEVDANGAWNCELSPLATGLHNLVAWATNPSDDTTSDDVSFTALIGVAYQGVVKMTNRGGTPMEGVVVSYQTASTTTDANGAFDLPIPDEAGVSPTLSKRGWSFSLESATPGDDGLFRYAASPGLETKSYSIWDSPTAGFTHTLKLLNKGETGATLSWSLVNSNGSILSATSEISLGALQDYRGDLSAGASSPSAYGFVEVENSQGLYDGELESFIPGSADAQLRALAVSPLSNSLQGNSFVMFNTAAAVLNTETDLQFVENVLLLSNVDNEPRSFTVRYFSRSGSPLRSTRLELAARTTGRLVLGGPAQKRVLGGLIEIEPDDLSAPYVGSLRRYGYRYKRDPENGTITRSKSFFVMSENVRQASAGELAIRHEYPSTRSGLNYLEIANTADKTISVTITHYGQEIRRLPTPSRRISKNRRPTARFKILKRRTTRSITLPSRKSAQLALSAFIKTSTEGIITISASLPNSVIANTVTHFYSSKGYLHASKLAPIEEVFGDDQLGFYESNVSSAVWLSNVSDTQAIASLECVGGGHAMNIIPLTIPPRESSVAKLPICFGAAGSGIARVNFSIRGGIIIDRIRGRGSSSVSERTRFR
jgi:hypothetical protein